MHCVGESSDYGVGCGGLQGTECICVRGSTYMCGNSVCILTCRGKKRKAEDKRGIINTCHLTQTLKENLRSVSEVNGHVKITTGNR